MSKEDVVEKKELEVRNAGELAMFIDHEEKVVGFEDMDSSTMAVPFIKVLNQMSPELDTDSTQYMKGATQGDIVNTISKKNYGKSLVATCVKFEHIVIEWQPNRGGFAGYHTPVEAEKITFDRSVFGQHKTKEGNVLSDTYMYYWVVQGHERDGVVVFAADSADIKQGKKLNAEMLGKFDAKGRKAPPYAQLYKMETIKDKNDQGSWYKPVYSFVGFLQDAQAFEIIKGVIESLKETVVDYSKADGEKTEPAQNTSKADLTEY